MASRISRVAARAAACISGAIALSAAFVVPAAAEQVPWPNVCHNPVSSPDGGAKVCFTSEDEIFHVCDTGADGHHPVGHLWWSGGQREVHAYGGYGTCERRDYSIPEGTTVYFKACNYEGDVILNCSGTRSARA